MKEKPNELAKIINREKTLKNIDGKNNQHTVFDNQPEDRAP